MQVFEWRWDPVLVLVTEPQNTHTRLVEIVTEAVLGGVDVVIWRDKRPNAFRDEEQTRAMYRAMRGQRGIKPNRRASLIVNGGLCGGAGSVNYFQVDGFHVGEATAEVPGEWDRVLRYREGGLRSVGRSIHSLEAAEKARDEEADYLLAGTIYPSQSHRGEPGQGIEFLRQVCDVASWNGSKFHDPLPVIAIGGITPERVGECITAGASGVAVLSPIMRADDPRAAAARYREELDKAWNLRSMENA